MSKHDEDARKRSNNLLNVSEHERKLLEQRVKETSPSRNAPDDPDDPGGETAAPGGVHSE